MTNRLAKKVAEFPLSPEIEWALDNAMKGNHVWHLREKDGTKCVLFVTTAIETLEQGRLAVGFSSTLKEDEEWETYSWSWWTKELEKGTKQITPEGAMDIIWSSPNEMREKNA